MNEILSYNNENKLIKAHNVLIEKEMGELTKLSHVEVIKREWTLTTDTNGNLIQYGGEYVRFDKFNSFEDLHLYKYTVRERDKELEVKSIIVKETMDSNWNVEDDYISNDSSGNKIRVSEINKLGWSE